MTSLESKLDITLTMESQAHPPLRENAEFTVTKVHQMYS
jgi:hypothetical protein